MDAITGANLKIARRAFAQARADFATWQMMARLRSETALSQEAQTALADHAKLVQNKTIDEAAALERSIQALYRRYYVDMGGTGVPPDLARLTPTILPRQDGPPPPQSHDNVTPFRPRPKAKPSRTASQPGKRPMPVVLIFAAMVAIAVLIKYFFP